MDSIKKIITGDAHSKPAKTADGAFTTQDSDNAHTLEGTSAKDSSVKSTGVVKDVDNAVDNKLNQAGVPKSADNEINSEINKRM